MPVTELNHINIKAPQPLLDEVRNFYIGVIGLTEGPRPNISRPGYWLYACSKAIVHLMEESSPEAQLAAGHLDHVAFTCSDIDAFEADLNALGVTFRRNDMPQFGLRQLFLQDPTGLGVELNFPYDA